MLTEGVDRPSVEVLGLDRRIHGARSRGVRLVLTVASAVLGLALVAFAARYFAETSWPLVAAHPGLLVAAGVLSLLATVLKAYGWRQLFAANERPQVLALAAANGGAAITALVLPGRFDDIVRIAIVRRFRDCPANVRAICLSLGMLGLIDSAALAPLAFASAALPGLSIGVRLGLELLAGVGLVAAALVFALPRIARGKHVLRFRIGRWLSPRTTSPRDAAIAWAFITVYWVARTTCLLVLLGALGVGFSPTLALLFLCASSAAAALPIGPGGTATQAGAGAAVLMASGVGVSEAVAVAVAVQLMGLLMGGSVFLGAVVWRTRSWLTLRHEAVPAASVGSA